LEAIVPIYEYRCSACAFQKEYLQKVSDPLLSVCPECGKETFGKMLTAAGFQLKGGGWYVTDFKNNGAKSAAKLAGENGAAKQSESKSASGGESKSANEGESKSKGDSKGDSKNGSKVETKTAAAAPAASAAKASASKSE
jgi:putative FmdB family regulatory protein